MTSQVCQYTVTSLLGVITGSTRGGQWNFQAVVQLHFIGSLVLVVATQNFYHQRAQRVSSVYKPQLFNGRKVSRGGNEVKKTWETYWSVLQMNLHCCCFETERHSAGVNCSVPLQQVGGLKCFIITQVKCKCGWLTWKSTNGQKLFTQELSFLLKHLRRD